MRFRSFAVIFGLLSLLSSQALLAQAQREGGKPTPHRRHKAKPAEEPQTPTRTTRHKATGETKSATTDRKRTHSTPESARKTGTRKHEAKAPEASGGKRVDARKPAATKPLEAKKPEARKPAEVKKPEPKKPAEVKKPADTPKPAEVKKPAEAPKPAEVKKPAEAPKPVEVKRPAEAIPPATGLVGEADRAYDRKSYAIALRKYRDAVGGKQVPDSRRALVDYRIARCLGWTKDWDNALASTQTLVGRYPGGLWEARGRSWLMQLYLQAPHDVWQVGTRFYRTDDAPEVKSEHEPQQVDMRDQDLAKAVSNGEQAKALYQKIRKDQPDTSEEADFSADLAQVVSSVQLAEWAQPHNWKAPTDPTWRLDRDAPYDPAWAPPKKVLELYLHAERLGSAAQKPLARLMQGLWLRNYQAKMREYAQIVDEKGVSKPIPFPYQDRSPLEVLRSLTKDYPAHPEAEHARVIVAQWLEADGKRGAALEAYQQYLKDKPNGKWAATAKALADGITRLRLEIDPPAPQAPGEKAKLEIKAVNLPSVKLTAHRVKLEQLVRDARVMGAARSGVENLFTLLGKRDGIAKFYQGQPVSWDQKLPDKKDYQPVEVKAETPLNTNGAWIIEADGGPVKQSVLLVISDLAVIQMVEREKAYAMVVHSGTGAPVADASAMIREVYHTATEPNKSQISAATSPTDADGLASKPLAPKRTYSENILTFAWKGDRYAVTGGGWNRAVTGPQQDRTAYVYTERPVYRPSQVVYYRALLAGRAEDGQWTPAIGKKVRVKIYDPKGAEISNQPLDSSEFGSVNGKVELASEPPLGEYRIDVIDAAGANGRNYGVGTFRVEEYKKPEFEVGVKGSDTPARVGDKLKAKITARYYFGAPVAGAKVHYTVNRSEFFPGNPFPRPYEFLYNTPEPGADRPWWSDEWVPVPDGEVASGDATTDANGEAQITIDTKLDNPRLKGRHVQFAVHAEVTDASRRTINGDGTVRALASQFNAFVHLRQGFYSAGDTLQADIRTLDADGKPVAAAGKVRIIRLSFGQIAGIPFKPGPGAPPIDPALLEQKRRELRNGTLVEIEAHSEALKTDAEGRAVFSWKPDQPGNYAIRFEARDAWEQLVSGEDRTWVAGDMAGAGVFHDRHVLLIPEQTTYRIGQKAKVLLVSDEPSATVLLTQEAGDRLLDRRVIRMESRSMVLEIPIGREQSPDIVLAVTGIRDREYFRSDAHLYVPPAEQLLTMELTADKAQYKPGEKAKFHLRARDVDGKAVRTEASVGVVDSSVFYIAGDATSPIAQHFYYGERGSGLQPQESLSPTWETLDEDAQPVPKWDGEKWQFPDGLGTLDQHLLQENSEFSMDGTMLSIEADDVYSTRATTSGRANPFHGERQMRTIDSIPKVAAAPAEAPAGNVAPKLDVYKEKLPAIGGVPGFDKDEAKRRGPQVRSNFADTAFWAPAVVTDAKGEATVEVTWPDNLTQWRATTRGWTSSAQVGEASADVTTSKDLLVRLQAPRFFVERDEVVLSANVHNYTQADQRVRVQLQLDGDTLYSAASSPSGPPRPRPLHVPRADRPIPAANPVENVAAPAADPSMEQWIDLPKGSEKRVDWRVRVERPGDAKVRILAEAGNDSDAMEMGFPVYTHGVEKLVVKGGSMLMAPGEKAGTKSTKLTMDLPLERATDSGELIVQVNPSIAASMLDALPYLVDYPYGCVEQTMSRFLPSVVCAKTLTDLGINLQDLQKKSALEYERLKKQSPTDRLAQSGYTYPEGSPGLRDVRRMMLDQWSWRANKSPVYNPELMKKMVAEGLARLRRFQNADGGWGWWQNDKSDPHMTAYVVQGLIAGKAAGVPGAGEMLTKGLASLDKSFDKTTDVNELAYEGWVLTSDPARAKRIAPILLDKVYAKREKLAPYSLALLGLALQQSGKPDEAKICAENLENLAKVDPAAGTCSWARGTQWWEWYNSPVETAAMALRAFNKINPKHRLAPMIVRWLSARRTGDAWSSTRDTAMAIQALAEYVKANRELAPDYTITVTVGDQFKRDFKVTAENALLFDNRLVVPAPALGNGPQAITVTRSGQGNLYYQAFLRYFSLEEGIQATGNEIRVRRRYFRLEKPAASTKLPKDAPVTSDGYVRSLVRPGQRLTSGDLVEVELLLESKNDYDHLVFEDMKPAGCEPVDLQSGSRYGGGLCSNMELRDEKVAFFISELPQGKHILTYRVRAEIPGSFHALPLNGYAMYAPEVRCISDEGNFGIEDAVGAKSARR